MIRMDGMRLFTAEATGIRSSVTALVLLSAAGHVGAVLWALSDSPGHEVMATAGSAVVMEVTLIAGPAQASPGEATPPPPNEEPRPTKNRSVSKAPSDAAGPARLADRVTNADRRIVPDTTEFKNRFVDLPVTITAAPIPPPRPQQPKPSRDSTFESASLSHDRNVPNRRTTAPMPQPAANSGASEPATGEPGTGMLGAAPRANNPAPSYPASARRRGQEGRVLLQVEVLANGNAGSVTLEKSSGIDSLDAAALDTVRRWRFRPARKNGQPVAATVQIPIRFALN